MALFKKKDLSGPGDFAALTTGAAQAKKKNRKKADFVLDLDEILVRAVRQDAPLSEVSQAPTSHPLSELTDQAAFNEAVAKAATEAGLKKGSTIAIDLPRSAVVLRQITVPFVADANEINSMVHFQVSRDLPFKPEDAILDFQFQRELTAPLVEQGVESDSKEKAIRVDLPNNGTRLEVLVAAVKREVLARYVDAAEAAGFKVGQVSLRSLSNLRGLSARQGPNENAACLITLRWDEIVIEVGLGTTLAVSRVVLTAPEIVRRLRPATPHEVDPVPEILSLINTEVIRTFHAFEGMAWQKPIAEVVIAGELGIENGLLEKLQKRVQVPCSVVPAEAAATSSISGLKLLTQENLAIDFLDPKKPRVVTDTRKIKILAAIAASIVFLFILFGVRANLVNKRLKVKLQVQNEITESEKKQAIYRRLRQQVMAVRGWGKTSPTWLDHYAYLSSVLPPATDLYVSSMTSSSAGTLRLAVQARTGEILADMEKKFRAAGYSVKPISITPGTDRYGYNFRTTVELLIPSKFKVDLKKLESPPRPDDDMPPATADASTPKTTLATTRP